MVKTISPQELKAILAGEERKNTALLDVREHGEYNSGHILGATSLPRRLIESELCERVPYTGTLLVLCDDDEKRANLAAETLEAMGYDNTRILEGGLNRWIALGYSIEPGMNTSSKIFGEKVLSSKHVKEITPEDLKTRIAHGENVVIFDARTPEEFQTSSIPGAVNIPGGEIPFRIRDLLKDQGHTIVVHCAGRTRGIIGTATLQRMGYRNAYALKNGTMGWALAGFKLQRGQKNQLKHPSTSSIAASEAFAAKVAKEENIQYVSTNDLQQVLANTRNENIYPIDVRTQEEYIEGHIPGFQWIPGGQAVQEAEQIVAVPEGKIIFTCDARTRSTLVASWYKQMGFPNVCVVDGGVASWSSNGLPIERGFADKTPFGFEEAKVAIESLSPKDFQAMISSERPIVLFVDPSDDYADGHIPGSKWLQRGWLEFRVNSVLPSKKSPVGVTCFNGLISTFAGSTLRNLGYEKVFVLAGGMKAWREARLPVATGLEDLGSEPDDAVHIGATDDRNKMINYLTWEQELGKKY